MLTETMFVAFEREFFRRTGNSVSSVTLEACLKAMWSAVRDSDTRAKPGDAKQGSTRE